MARANRNNARPETKAQRAIRRDSQFECSHCPASYDSASALGVHVAAAHTNNAPPL